MASVHTWPYRAGRYLMESWRRLPYEEYVPDKGQSTAYGPTARAYPRQGIRPGGILVAKDPAMHARP